MSNKKKSKQVDVAVNADRFFATLKLRDIHRMKKVTNTVMFIALIFMFFVTMSAIGVLFLVTMRPTPVIAFDSKGKRAVFAGTETVQDETSRVRIYRFMTDFINKYEGVSPNIEEDLTEAYNMLTPKFRQILLDKAVHKEKIAAWKNKNFETKFKIRKIKFLRGSLKVGSSVTIEGYGEMFFRNAIDYNNEGTQRKDFVYFTAVLLVTPVTLDLSPDGLFIDIYQGKSLGDFRSLRAFLTSNKKEYLINDDSKEVFQ